MKTKEQLAEEYARAWQGFNTGKRFNPAACFIAGYDQAMASLDKLPVFDEKAAKEGISDQAFSEFGKKLYTPNNFDIHIARWQHQQVAKIIAAKDALISKLQVCADLYDLRTAERNTANEKIRELEMNLASGSLDVLKQYKQLQAANSLIGELEEIHNKIANRDPNSWVTELQWTHRALEKIKHYKQGEK